MKMHLSQHLCAAAAKMSAGTALSDADRQPWLEALAAVIARSTTG